MLRGRLKIPTKIKHLYANSVDSILINEAQSTDLRNSKNLFRCYSLWQILDSICGLDKKGWCAED